MSGASIETTLELWASSLREVKARMRPLFLLATRADLTYEPSATFYEIPDNSGGNDVAVYRLFDTNLGTHFYTGDATEYAGLTTPGSATYRPDLTPEGISFYAPAGSYT